MDDVNKNKYYQKPTSLDLAEEIIEEVLCVANKPCFVPGPYKSKLKFHLAEKLIGFTIEVTEIKQKEIDRLKERLDGAFESVRYDRGEAVELAKENAELKKTIENLTDISPKVEPKTFKEIRRENARMKNELVTLRSIIAHYHQCNAKPIAKVRDFG